ncbi:MAG: phosphoribosylformylglycinamidine cyclo-ligase [Desulfurococcaceae archaeon]|nr:phosphoribosylformylglycinamidine cyclo-ligase [Desulfurococcaceae archaeon]
MSGWTYSKAGVDLVKHRAMHKHVLDVIEKLNKELGYEVEGLGGYATSIKWGSSKLVLHIDGVGTKTLVLQKLGKHRVAGWDCVAMNVNDVVCGGVKPIALVDYIAMPIADEKVFAEIVEGVVEASRYAGVAVLGGETAILPDLVNGYDVVCAVIGVKKWGWSPRVDTGDIVVGVSSWGLHANGYSLVRKVLDSLGIDYSSTIKEINLGEELAKPTAIYSNLVLELIEKNLIKGVANITGGAFTKVKRLINRGIDIVLDMPRPPKIFELVMKLGGIDVEEMYRVFNMGIGMVLATEDRYVEEVKGVVEKHGFNFYILGKAVPGSGRVIVNTPYGVTLVF